jgi:nitrogen fixation protein NifB
METAIELLTESHPCYNEHAHSKIGRIHLPVAAKCNIGCKFCDRRVGEFYHSSRPGLTERIISPEESVEIVKKALENNPAIKVIGIAGPGEPLFNESTFDTLRLISRNFPDQQLCVCTNGLLMPRKIDLLHELGVSHITITINAIDSEIGQKINDMCILNGKKYEGLEAAKLLIENQLEGLERAVENGMKVKINSILIPEINMVHMQDIAREIKIRGAGIMNIMPLIPLGNLKNYRAPTCDELKEVRKLCEPEIPIFRLCVQCRADACGIPGLE